MSLPTRESRVTAVALHIAALDPGQTLTHQAIRVEIGLDMDRARDGAIWQAARRRAVCDHGVVLRSVRGIGYVRLTHQEVADDQARIRRIRAQARRGLEESDTVDVHVLGEDQRARHATKAMVMAAIVTQTRPAALKPAPSTSPSAARALLGAKSD
jgi:hypothetical protein